MKLGATLSAIGHVSILAWGLLTLTGPKPHVVAQVEALSIDIVPIEEITKAVQGDKKADLSETPAPTPTKKPVQETPAENVGETDKDTKTPREAEKKSTPVEEASAPAAEPTPVEPPKPTVVPEPAPKPVEKDVPAPTTEIASLIEPKVAVQEDPAEQTPEVSETAEQFAKLPDNVPAPTARPKPPKAKSAQTTDRKKSETKPAKKADASSKSKKKSSEDQIAALLNKQEASKGGKKRSTKKASLGTKKGKAAKLSTSEMDALRSAIEQCWSVPIGLSDAEDMRVTITMRLSPDGSLDGKPKVIASGGEKGARRAFSGSARRAVMKCAPYNLPAEKYETWSEVIVNFDPSQMF